MKRKKVVCRAFRRTSNRALTVNTCDPVICELRDNKKERKSSVQARDSLMRTPQLCELPKPMTIRRVIHCSPLYVNSEVARFGRSCAVGRVAVGRVTKEVRRMGMCLRKGFGT
eukprot:TRINITY_DN525_c0_g1_i2.p1 TRINITY_DN525_c0_g1~~TRINITY_DN525_c0_g1_i2.p1  ORF type:complete len:113 (-),score=7.13 TRINITY_DN525_c0_g1_i2:633-971(-)